MYKKLLTQQGDLLIMVVVSYDKEFTVCIPLKSL